jgi:hypothetical protein
MGGLTGWNKAGSNIPASNGTPVAIIYPAGIYIKGLPFV